MDFEPFSVLLCTYEGDSPRELQRALESVFEQTAPPAEVVVVADGPLSDRLESVLDEFETAYPDVLERVSLPTNKGLGEALRVGVEACSHDLVARMDADDVALESRFERQLTHLTDNPDVDVLGGYIAEFSDDPEKPEFVREVPTSPDAVQSKARFRCPVNHPSVMFRRGSVLEAGNYRPLRSMQDYELWMRMLSRGYTLANLPAVLVHCAASEALYRRRGGLEYARLEVALQYGFLQMDVISAPVFLFNVSFRVPVRLFPNRLRSAIYRGLLRR